MEGIFKDLPTFETDRLVLRKAREEDIHDIYEYASEQEISRYTPWNFHKTIDTTQKLVEIIQDNYNNDKESDWVIELKENNKVIGLCGFVRWNKHHNRIEVAYSLSRSHWGKGYTTEAVEQLVKFGFENMQLNRIEAKVSQENSASIKVLEKLGMKPEGILRDYWFKNGEYTTVQTYSVIKSDWVNSL
ncbi:GNAT family protein [Pseudalkalibacillus sp. SCS-8]|uniref:GNAT family N-acetyltransferase n=1 Tax=Pseudalkalibacillus nanhaiensis TaxID=3115291 RepID=UPI0032D9E23F